MKIKYIPTALLMIPVNQMLEKSIFTFQERRRRQVDKQNLQVTKVTLINRTRLH